MAKIFLATTWKSKPSTVELVQIRRGIRLFLIFRSSDYRPVPELDKYDAEDLDEETYDNMEIDVRLQAEREMKKRDKHEGRLTQGRIKDSLLYSELSEDFDQEQQHRTKRKYHASQEGIGEQEEQIESIENLEVMKGHGLREWIKMVGPKTEIYNRFKNFLKTIVDEHGHNVFREKIRYMVEGSVENTFPALIILLA
jgi:DNA replication licensing factor MCM2